MTQLTPIYQRLKMWNAESVLILTYEFDEKDLVGLFSDKGNKDDAARKLQRIRPVIIYDKTKTKDFRNYLQFVEIHPSSNRNGIHHSKAYLCVFKNSIQFTLGSFNLTDTGLFKNREVFKTFQFNKEDSENISILTDYIHLLEKNYLPKEKREGYAQLNEVIKQVKNKIKDWKLDLNHNAILIDSGYGESGGLKKVKQVFLSNIGEPVTHCYFVSPFLDQSSTRTLFYYFKEEGFIQNSTEIKLITSKTSNRKLPFTIEYLNKLESEFKNFEIYLSESRVDKENSLEWKLIESELENRSAKKIKDYELVERMLHAKIMLLYNQNLSKGLLYIGSANFTVNAWSGKNQELGFVQTLAIKSIDDIFENLKKIYNVVKYKQSENDIFSTLEEEEEYDPNDYPLFIVSILLKVSQEKEEVYFEMSCDNNLEINLEAYETTWGAGEKIDWKKITETSYLSNSFSIKNLVSLLQYRNLKFRINDNSYFFPYLYSQDIEDSKESILYKGSEDWLLHYLNNDSESVQFTDNDEDLSEIDRPTHVSEVEREKNLTIQMQKFISYIPKMEESWRRNIENSISEDGEIQFEDIWSLSNIYNIASYLKLLKQELKEGKYPFSASFFKISEFILIMKRILIFLTTKNIFEKMKYKFERVIEEETKYLRNLLVNNKGEDLSKITPFKEYIEVLYAE